MIYHFCTIITTNYLPYAQALRDSIISQVKDSCLHVFVSALKSEVGTIIKDNKNIEYIFIEDLCKTSLGKNIYDKYYIENKNAFRWSMKGVLMSFLLEHKVSKLIYIDCDICFYNDFKFLFEYLDYNDILLTPHWTVSLPDFAFDNFISAFQNGLFNAGFIGASKNGIKALKWYSTASYQLCTNKLHCILDDQSYLNLIPIYFDNIKIIKHKGCNVAGWNSLENKRSIDKNGDVLICDHYPIIFIHFSNNWLKEMYSGSDILLRKHLDDYLCKLSQYGFNTMSLMKYLEPENYRPNIPFIKKIKNAIIGRTVRILFSFANQLEKLNK